MNTAGAGSATGADGAGVTVTGSGRAGGSPDVVWLDLASEASSSDVQKALDTAAQSLAAMRSELLAAGIPEKDLRTTDTSLWSGTGPNGQGPVLHTARLGLGATVRDVSTAGRVLSRALRAGGQNGRMSGLRFTHRDPADLLTSARAAAFADAEDKARQFAQLAGRPLGRVVEITELAVPHPMPRFARMTSAGAEALASADVGLDAGEHDVTASVTVTWAWG